MVWASSITRRGATVAGAAAARRPRSIAAAARVVRRPALFRDNNGDEATKLQPQQRRKLSAKPAPAPAPAASAAPTPTATGPAAQEKGISGGGGGSGGDAAEELWIVGRVLDDMDTRLGAKQEKIRVREIGVIERFAAVVSALDGSLKPREGDEFLAWLRSQGFDDAPRTPQPGGGPPTEEDETAAGKKVENQGNNGQSDGGAAEERAEVEAFLSAASARLNALVADKEDALFGDRGEAEAEESLQAKGERGGEDGTAAAGGDASGEPVVSPNMSDEDLYQAKLGVHRAMLCHFLSILSSSLGKQQLKTGLSLEEVAAATRSAYLAAPEDRLAAVYPLFDTHGDGHLDTESADLAVDAVVLSVTAASERCYAAAARPALDKKAAAAMPATMKYVLWDVMEVPMKRRCSFAWAEDRKQVGPDEWRVGWEQFAPSRKQHFPEMDSVARDYVAEFSRRRSAWHTSRKGRKEAMVYGSALFVAVLFIDNLLKMV
ncbi:expressed unknown protein [Ectocarpus siliculosus]|uniref:Uncharacterized protein n=1 Tax=Ectocarpus siliculosus TaxID=2880 RepID=D8LHK3_ECTSI|nr:expressed unknown protein [Ectocarpus siliculosus]|eukprot:CBN79285.1 expressed unknown protein [Ectocarpus siliculosus]